MTPEEALTNLALAIREHGHTPCMTTDPEAFFPEKGNLDGDARRAKALCAECPVRAECLTFGLVNNEPYGIWGGLTTPQRA